jgi:hypothetical protein
MPDKDMGAHRQLGRGSSTALDAEHEWVLKARAKYLEILNQTIAEWHEKRTRIDSGDPEKCSTSEAPRPKK